MGPEFLLASTHSPQSLLSNIQAPLFPPSAQVFSGCDAFTVQRFAPADVPADLTDVDCCVDQWPPDVSILAQVDGSSA